METLLGNHCLKTQVLGIKCHRQLLVVIKTKVWRWVWKQVLQQFQKRRHKIPQDKELAKFRCVQATVNPAPWHKPGKRETTFFAGSSPAAFIRDLSSASFSRWSFQLLFWKMCHIYLAFLCLCKFIYLFFYFLWILNIKVAIKIISLFIFWD